MVSVAAKTLFLTTVSQSFCLPPQSKHMWTLGRGKHILAKLWFTLITGLQMLQILSEKNITWGRILRLLVVRWNRGGRAPGTAGSALLEMRVLPEGLRFCPKLFAFWRPGLSRILCKTGGSIKKLFHLTLYGRKCSSKIAEILEDFLWQVLKSVSSGAPIVHSC